MLINDLNLQMRNFLCFSNLNFFILIINYRICKNSLKKFRLILIFIKRFLSLLQIYNIAHKNNKYF